ncbi:hypothetical protein GALMADRAFT_247726 [Galerina marginata CBS 339.88]|uniref:Kri1-like C-terminal domain-containing protein n=1 Tax=Galerina marginata (strain CBS 339.88) TaxID=685588 RepID=A0A067T8V1_GALM3|nr:hypothetical protein GALMADRAFT_247726 [Galerina marginata CBS 339.88]
MSKLFSDDEGSVNGGDRMLTINEHYARAFEHRKEREELERLQAKYGSDYDPDASDAELSTDSESAESEDEHGEELTPAVDVAILRTLARIKRKDPEIYDSEKNIFGQESERLATQAPKRSEGQVKPKSKSKPATIRQANLDAMLNPSRSASPESDLDAPMTHVQEQEVLRRQTIAAFHGAVTEDGEDDFLIPREKTQDEREREEEEYRAFLEREVGDLRDLVSVDGKNESGDEERLEEREPNVEEQAEGGERKKKKKQKKSKIAVDEQETKPKKTKAEKDQEFLLDYIMNRGWIDRSEGRVPTYNEVTSQADERRKKKGKSKAKPQDEDDSAAPEEADGELDTGLLSDSSFESVASFFEASYNHRFEEPGAATIPSFPRNLPSLVRREDTTRKEARERRKQRKEEELRKKREEVQRLKALKMREVKRKLDLVSKQGGLRIQGAGDDDEFVDEALRELDLEGEWDPERHDRQMAGLFDRGADAFENDGGFEDDEDVQFDADGKPVWDDDVDIGDIPISDDEAGIIFDDDPQPSKKEKKKKKKKKKGEDKDEAAVDIDAMDADAQPRYDEDEEWDGTEEMRKRKFNEYMDEIYGLEFNDLVGDLPTRFKYVPVQAQHYALTPAEILMATDQELNEYMSVKKYAPYRQEKDNRSRYGKKTQEKLHEFKAKVGERVGTNLSVRPGGADAHQGEKVKKRKGKKERMKMKATVGGVEGEEVADVDLDETPQVANAKHGPELKKLKKRKREPDDDLVERGDKNGDGDNLDDGAGEGAAKKKRKRHRNKEALQT